MNLTICYVTGRQEPRLDWMIDTLVPQIEQGDNIHLIVVDALLHERRPTPLVMDVGKFATLRHVLPKPTIWQGKHRVTRENWWAMSSARNTGFALCQTEWIAFLDDRCMLLGGWLDAIRRARAGNYVVCGGYEKRHFMGIYRWRCEVPSHDRDVICSSQPRCDYTLPDTGVTGVRRCAASLKLAPGEDLSGGRRVSIDNRFEANPEGNQDCGGQWLYGCSFALPLEWALNVNGFEEGCDGLSAEDYIFGLMLKNRGYRIDYDPKMWVVQDRSPTKDPGSSQYRRADKGVSPNDKSHAALERFGKRDRTEFTPDLTLLRRTVLELGRDFPIPDPDTEWKDWYDGQPIREL